MGDVLDNLFAIIPIVLAILWLMRRTAKRRTGQEKKPVNPRTAEPAQKAQEPAGTRLSRGIRRLEQTAKNVTHSGGLHREQASKATPGEDALYEKIENHRIETGPITAPPPAAAAVQGKRIVRKSDIPGIRNEPGKAVSTSSLERFKTLSPLAQAMIWSIILEEPPALKEPKY